ncbi:MAG: hypothetical protein GXN99_00050, partial [Candidatus Nanohaloarchaeota archaeon]|nr:hypothetical protein [Candidatus Nanohaloarchaeota archaeon]
MFDESYPSNLYGYIYDVSDFSLFKECVININSTPSINLVVETGSYNLSLLPGCYHINVSCYRDGLVYGQSDAVICLSSQSNIRYDFLIFPNIENKEETDLLIEDDSLPSEYPFMNSLMKLKWYYLLILLIPPIIGVFLYKKRKNIPVAED